MRLIFDWPRLRWRRFAGVALFLLAVFLALPSFAAASTATSAPTLVLPWQQIWPIVIGGLVPLSTYALNHWAPWISQPVKAVVLVAVSTVATALYTALATNVIGFNDATLQLILTSVASSLAAHHLLWKPSGISTLLGAYADYGIAARWGKHGAPGHPVPVVPSAAPATTPATPTV